MNGFPWESVIAVLGLAVPVVAAAWEFALVGRRRLGYRVQMDTTATDAAHSPYAGVLQQMRRNGTPLLDPSFVLLRIRNNGWTLIDAGDYVVRDDDQAHGHRPCSELAKPLLCRPT